jgi:hypothetical protein
LAHAALTDMVLTQLYIASATSAMGSLVPSTRQGRAMQEAGTLMKRMMFASLLSAMAMTGVVASLTGLTAIEASAAGSLGDLSSLQAIVSDVQTIAGSGDFTKAEKRITDFETLWDADEETLKPMNKKAWHHVDDASDAALKALRTKKPDATEVNDTLSALSAALANP